MTDAIVVTLVRVAVTHRNAEWQPARTGRLGARRRASLLKQMLGSACRAVCLVVRFSRPSALTSAAPVLLLWTVAPTHRVGLRPVPGGNPRSDPDYQLFRSLAEDLALLDTFSGSRIIFCRPTTARKRLTDRRPPDVPTNIAWVSRRSPPTLWFSFRPGVHRAHRPYADDDRGNDPMRATSSTGTTPDPCAALPRYVSSVDSETWPSALLTARGGTARARRGLPESRLRGAEELAALLHRANHKGRKEKSSDC